MTILLVKRPFHISIRVHRYLKDHFAHKLCYRYTGLPIPYGTQADLLIPKGSLACIPELTFALKPNKNLIYCKN